MATNKASAWLKAWPIHRSLAIVLTAGFFLIGASTAVQAAQTLVFGHGAAPGNPRSIAAKHMAKLVQKYSDGDLKLQIQGSEQLGSDLQMLQQAQSGAIAITANSQGPLATIVPEVSVFGLPMLFDSPQAAWKVVDGPIGEEVKKKASQRGLKVLAFWGNGMREITNNVRPIKKPQDMNGLKIRTPQDALTIATMKALGANPTPMAFGELYVALKQGTVDGQENPIVNIMSSNLDEVQKYLTMANYRYEVTPVIVGMPTWQRLSKKDQNALLKAAQQSKSFERQLLVKKTKQYLQQIRKNNLMQINQIDRSAFRKAIQPVYTQWQNKLGDIAQRAEKAAAKANQTTRQDAE